MTNFVNFTDITQITEKSSGEENESSVGAKNKLKGIIRKGIVQRKAARRFARQNIQFDSKVDVYSRRASIDPISMINFKYIYFTCLTLFYTIILIYILWIFVLSYTYVPLLDDIDHISKGTQSDKDVSEDDNNKLVIESPESSIRMISPEPPELPLEFSNMVYSEINKVILSMSSDINDDDEEDGEDSAENVFKSVREEEETLEDPFPDRNENVLNSHKMNTTEDEKERGESYPILDLSKNGIENLNHIC